MSQTLAVSLLRQGNTGNELLQILDTLVADESSDNDAPAAVPTLDPLAF